MISHKQLLSGATLVAGGIVEPEKFRRWIAENRVKEGQDLKDEPIESIKLLKFLLDAHATNKMEEWKLKESLGRWVNGCLGAQLSFLEHRPGGLTPRE